MTRVLRQMEECRQGGAVIEVRDAGGQPCADVPVWAEQETHHFEFGVIVPDLASFSEPQRQTCLERMHELFNQFSARDLAGSHPLPSPSARSDLAASTTQTAEGEGLGVRVLVDLSRNDAGAARVPLGRIRSILDQESASGKRLCVLLSGRTIDTAQKTEAPLPEREIALRVANLYALCFSHPAVRRIVWQGLTDREPGVAGNGLLRDDLSPKPAFQALRKLLGLVWHSRASGETDEQGRFEFRGFLGKYRVVANVGAAAPEIAHVSLLGNSDENHFTLGGMLSGPLQNRLLANE
ncbi:MAG: hypothetical protein HY040_23235 [Planctomycetes bacterium]|nr:hypothetical protein [Planctomycetota bacterium]